jgi:transmembrane 9 superfamily member 2/4
MEMLVGQSKRNGANASTTYSTFSWLLLLSISSSPTVVTVNALHISYDKARDFVVGEKIPMYWNKLTSPTTLSSMDMVHLPVCASEWASLGESTGSALASTAAATTTTTTSEEEENKRAHTGDLPVYALEKHPVWQKALDALHADVLVADGPNYNIQMLRDEYCRQLCWMELEGNMAESWQSSIARNFHYNMELDHMPAASSLEDRLTITTRYWGGSPIGRVGSADTTSGGEVETDVRFQKTTPHEMFIYNHWNIEIVYSKNDHNTKDNADDDTFNILRTTIKPYSILHEFQDAANGVDIFNPIASCQNNGVTAVSSSGGNNDGGSRHTNYQMILNRPPQPASGRVLFTYDVVWIRDRNHKSNKEAVKNRWDVFLTMDNSIPLVYQMTSLVFAIIINCIIFGVLAAWVSRDLSYKPIYVPENDSNDADGDNSTNNNNNNNNNKHDDDDDDPLTALEVAEMKLWPLSTQVFLPPRHNPFLLSIFCGIGLQLLLVAVTFLLLFRLGIINETIGANIITPGVVIYTLYTWVGGYVTARMVSMFDGTRAMAGITTFCTATLFPVLALVTIHVVYDVLPNSNTAPQYHAASASMPLVLIWCWLVIPGCMLGGYFGYRHGQAFLPAFPLKRDNDDHGCKERRAVLDVNEDEQEADESRLYKFWKCIRTPCLFILGGILPVLCCFVAFAYGIAGPVYLRYFSSTKLAILAPFGLFLSCTGGVATLLYYRQVRILQNYHWWWPAFVSGSSSGLHIFILAISWLLFNTSQGQVDASTFCIYIFWFAFISFGISCMCGAIGVACCVAFNMLVFRHTLRRGQTDEEGDDEEHKGFVDHDTDHELNQSKTTGTSRSIGTSSSSTSGILLASSGPRSIDMIAEDEEEEKKEDDDDEEDDDDDDGFSLDRHGFPIDEEVGSV